LSTTLLCFEHEIHLENNFCARVKFVTIKINVFKNRYSKSFPVVWRGSYIYTARLRVNLIAVQLNELTSSITYRYDLKEFDKDGHCYSDSSIASTAVYCCYLLLLFVAPTTGVNIDRITHCTSYT